MFATTRARVSEHATVLSFIFQNIVQPAAVSLANEFGERLEAYHTRMIAPEGHLTAVGEEVTSRGSSRVIRTQIPLSGELTLIARKMDRLGEVCPMTSETARIYRTGVKTIGEALKAVSSFERNGPPPCGTLPCNHVWRVARKMGLNLDRL